MGVMKDYIWRLLFKGLFHSLKTISSRHWLWKQAFLAAVSCFFLVCPLNQHHSCFEQSFVQALYTVSKVINQIPICLKNPAQLTPEVHINHTLICLANPDCTTCCTVHDKYTRLDRVWHQRGCSLFSTGDNHARNMDFCPGTARHLRLMLPWNALCCNLLQETTFSPLFAMVIASRERYPEKVGEEEEMGWWKVKELELSQGNGW